MNRQLLANVSANHVWQLKKLETVLGVRFGWRGRKPPFWGQTKMMCLRDLSKTIWKITKMLSNIFWSSPHSVVKMDSPLNSCYENCNIDVYFTWSCSGIEHGDDIFKCTCVLVIHIRVFSFYDYKTIDRKVGVINGSHSFERVADFYTRVFFFNYLHKV